MEMCTCVPEEDYSNHKGMMGVKKQTVQRHSWNPCFSYKTPCRNTLMLYFRFKCHFLSSLKLFTFTAAEQEHALNTMFLKIMNDLNFIHNTLLHLKSQRVTGFLLDLKHQHSSPERGNKKGVLQRGSSLKTKQLLLCWIV